MERTERIRRLKSLSPRQREVFKLFCSGSDYASIAEKLVITEGAVRAHMMHIYEKLGLFEQKQQERWKEIFQNYCPLVDEIGFAEAGSEPEPEEEQSEVIPEKVKKILDEDQHALVPIGPTFIKPPVKPEPPWWRRYMWLIGGALLIILLAVLALNWLGFLNWRGVTAEEGPTATQEQIALVIATTEAPASNTPFPEPTSTETLPSPTNPPPTFTPQPTPIPLALPFSDSFENGTRPEWSFYGNWLVTNGRLSVVFDDSEWRTAVLDLSGWQNYRVSVDIYLPYYGSANTGETAIFVRLDEINSKFIGFYQDHFGRGGWAYYPGEGSDPTYLGQFGEMDSVAPTATIELEVIGNQFTAYVNGIQYEQISITGYESGIVVLAMECQASSACPSFDNFSVEPIG